MSSAGRECLQLVDNNVLSRWREHGGSCFLKLLWKFCCFEDMPSFFFFAFLNFYQVPSLTKLFILIMMKYYFGCLLAIMFLLQMKYRVIWAIRYTVNWSPWLGYFFHLATCVVLWLSCLAAVPRLWVVETGLFQEETGRFQVETGQFQGLWITKSPHPPFYLFFVCG